MKTNKGFTLIEMAVVLAIIAILAAILTPIVTGYIDQARVTRAQNDVKKIGQAVLLYKRDTSVLPGYDTYANATAGGSTGLKACLTSDGTAPSAAQTGAANYNTSCTSTGDLQVYVNLNTMGVFTNNVSSEKVGGGTKFRGPYLDGLGGQDPWGVEYVVTSLNFQRTSGQFGPNYSFAVSAGPNAVFDTTFAQPRASVNGGVDFATGSDDVTSLIQ